MRASRGADWCVWAHTTNNLPLLNVVVVILRQCITMNQAQPYKWHKDSLATKKTPTLSLNTPPIYKWEGGGSGATSSSNLTGNTHTHTTHSRTHTHTLVVLWQSTQSNTRRRAPIWFFCTLFLLHCRTFCNLHYLFKRLIHLLGTLCV